MVKVTVMTILILHFIEIKYFLKWKAQLSMAVSAVYSGVFLLLVMVMVLLFILLLVLI